MDTPSLLQKRLVHYWAAARRYLRLGPSHAVMMVAARFQTPRRLAVWRARHRRSLAVVPAKQSLLEQTDVQTIVETLRTEGVAGGLRLLPEALESLQLFCAQAECFGNGESRYPLRIAERGQAELAYGRAFTVARYLECLRHCPSMQNLAADPAILSIAARSLGAEPVLLGARIWWSFPAGSEEFQRGRDGQSFHYDLDSYRALAFFFYLSDVDEHSGPHICVRGSHRSKPIRHLVHPLRERPDHAIRSVYGDHRIAQLCGPAGTGFVEDLFCYHKGAHPTRKDRLLLQLRFGLRRYGSGDPGE